MEGQLDIFDKSCHPQSLTDVHPHQERFQVQYSHCGCPIPGDTIGQKLIRLIGAQNRDPPPSHLLPFNRPDLLCATHPSDHNAVHFQSTSPDANKRAIARYQNLARQKEREAQKAAEKARKKANGARQRSVSLPVLLPPHAPHLQTPGRISTSRAPLYSYGTPFLVPVPLYVGAGLAGCVAPDTGVINPSGSCGVGGFNGSAGCGGTGGGEPRISCIYYS